MGNTDIFDSIQITDDYRILNYMYPNERKERVIKEKSDTILYGTTTQTKWQYIAIL